MVVQFRTVRSSVREQYLKDALIDTIGHSNVPFENQEDYIANITIDMDRVLDYVEGRIWYNDKHLECIYPSIAGESFTPPILCPPPVFKKIFEEAKNIEIKSFEQWK